jgi:hypothetical protein
VTAAVKVNHSAGKTEKFRLLFPEIELRSIFSRSPRSLVLTVTYIVHILIFPLLISLIVSSRSRLFAPVAAYLAWYCITR